MKKILRVVLVLGLALSLVACGSNEAEETEEVTEATVEDVVDETEEEVEEDEDEEEADAGALSGEINITGSTSVASIIEEAKNEFEANNPNITVNYTGTGSSSGVEDAINAVNDIGVASRAIKDEEVESGVRAEVFAQDGVAVIVHPDNEVDELTIDQILNIYNGTITNWSEVGGADQDINVMSREASSGTRSAFEELTGLEDDEKGMTDDKVEFSSNGTLQIGVAGDESAIGFVSFTYLDETVKGVKVDGGEPTTDSVKAGDYPLARPFNFAINDDNYSDLAKAFVDFVLSTEGQDIVEAEGGIRID